MIELILDQFSIIRLEQLRLEFWISLTLQPFSLAIVFVFSVGAECFTHVLVTKILFVEQMVRCCYVIVTVSLHTPAGVLLLKVKILDQPLQKLFVNWHLLKSRIKARLSGNLVHIF